MSKTKSRKELLGLAKKLWKLSSDEGSFEGEIANASAMLQKLMDEHSISMEELAAEESNEITRKFNSMETDAMLGKIRQWHWSLARVVGRVTHTKCYSTNTYSSEPTNATKGKKLTEGKTIAFFGNEDNIEIATQLFSQWLTQLTIMATIAVKKYNEGLLQSLKDTYGNHITDPYRPGNGIKLDDRHPNVYRTSWIKGCLQAMYNNVTEQEKTRDSEMETAIVAIKDHVWEAYKEFSVGFKQVSTTTSKFNSRGYWAGVKTGKDLHVGQKHITK